MSSDSVGLWRESVTSLLDEPGLLDAAYAQGYRSQVQGALEDAPVGGSGGQVGVVAEAGGRVGEGLSVGMGGYGSAVGTPATAARGANDSGSGSSRSVAMSMTPVDRGGAGGDSGSGSKPPVARSLTSFLSRGTDDGAGAGGGERGG